VEPTLLQIEVRLVTCAECIRGSAWVAPCVGGVVPLACSAVTRVRVQPYCISAKLATQTAGQHIPTSIPHRPPPSHPLSSASGLGFSSWPGARSTNGLLCNGRCQVACPATWCFQHIASCMCCACMWPWQQPCGVCCHTFLYVRPRLTPLHISVRLAACVAAGAVHGWGCAFVSFCSAEGEACHKHVAYRPSLQLKLQALTHPFQPALSSSSSFFSFAPECLFVVLGSHGGLLG
jgi:hypothetical protein